MCTIHNIWNLFNGAEHFAIILYFKNIFAYWHLRSLQRCTWHGQSPTKPHPERSKIKWICVCVFFFFRYLRENASCKLQIVSSNHLFRFVFHQKCLKFIFFMCWYKKASRCEQNTSKYSFDKKHNVSNKSLPSRSSLYTDLKPCNCTLHLMQSTNCCNCFNIFPRQNRWEYRNCWTENLYSHKMSYIVALGKQSADV